MLHPVPLLNCLDLEPVVTKLNLIAGEWMAGDK